MFFIFDGNVSDPVCPRSVRQGGAVADSSRFCFVGHFGSFSGDSEKVHPYISYFLC